MSVIVITGASAGVGLAVAERFAKAGWQVVAVARLWIGVEKGPR